MGNISVDLTPIVLRSAEIDSDIRAAHEKADELKSRERSFGLPITPHDRLNAVQVRLGFV